MGRADGGERSEKCRLPDSCPGFLVHAGGVTLVFRLASGWRYADGRVGGVFHHGGGRKAKRGRVGDGRGLQTEQWRRKAEEARGNDGSNRLPWPGARVFIARRWRLFPEVT